MEVIKEKLKQELDRFNKEQLEQVAEFIEFIKFRSQSHQEIIEVNKDDGLTNEEILSNLRQAWYEAMTEHILPSNSPCQEFTEEDRKLAEAGMTEEKRET